MFMTLHSCDNIYFAYLMKMALIEIKAYISNFALSLKLLWKSFFLNTQE